MSDLPPSFDSWLQTEPEPQEPLSCGCPEDECECEADYLCDLAREEPPE